MAKIKICGLTRLEDIQYVNEFMPDYAGFVFAGEKRKIDFQTSEELKKYLKPEIKAVGVFVNEDINFVAKLVEAHIIDLVQLHGDEDREYIKKLRKSIDAPIIKAVRVRNKESIIKAQRLYADYLLLDTYSEGIYGGTGDVFDRTVIPKEIKDYFLAGGLNMSNIKEALKECNPYAVDVSSGVETNGYKDREKIKNLIELIRVNSAQTERKK